MIEVPAVATVQGMFAAASYYGYIGIAVAAVFLLYGVDRIDPGARGSYLFRLFLIPAAVVFWPVILWRWAHVMRARIEP
ncbi:hypothetical protein [uncultured Nisaea sp.]|jgi:hypothetical protein|uniref:hypothetical protein n=1 Tax=uncultured Nisaea sp. TaxID=538215 RepID=UPI0030EE2163|tara:strand:- start:1321 stop:1557 length:237 start_codon:yes stop_codon:yes gene_type:complete